MAPLPSNRPWSPGIGGELSASKRNLPPWQVGGSVYCVTFRTKGVALTLEARRLVLDALRHFDGRRYRLLAGVVMPDHVHLLVQPTLGGTGEWWSLSSILHSLKSFTAKRINRLRSTRGAVWQDESFDRIVRDEDELTGKWPYLCRNPITKGLCADPDQWDALHECGRSDWQERLSP